MRYLQRVGKLFYFRIKVPIDLQTILVHREIRKSLKTTNRATAQSVIRALRYNMEKVFILLRSGLLKPDEIKRIVHQYYIEVLNNTELWTARETAPRTEELQAKRSKAYALVVDGLTRNLVLNRLASMDDNADALISEKRLDIRKDTDDYKYYAARC
jgi:hypothetical protein